MKRCNDSVIRAVNSGDRECWEPLWRGYLEFYGKRLPQEMIELTWARIVETNEVKGQLALDAAGTGLGLIHYFFHASTSMKGVACYIPDLYVVESARKRGIGQQLIEAVVNSARSKQVSVVYWQTEEFNGVARRLYETLAKRSPFIRYQIEL